MILDQRTPDIITSGNLDETMFDIDEDSLHIVFDVLRSKVYKNPIGSLCREIATNSRDAHREIDDYTTPTEVEIADGRDDFFFAMDGLSIIFRDFGVGLSPERIKKVYAKYGASTKRSTNKQTGGYGLGAKTPFAYCDAFTVRTIYNGTEYVYSMYIDETKKGKIALLVEQPYEGDIKGNMSEIIVPLKDNDREKFEREVFKATHFWDVRPKLINFKRSFYEIAAHHMNGVKADNKAECLLLEKEGFIESSVNVIIDGIYYPVDMEAIGHGEMYQLDFAMLFKYNNGELNVGASREQLQYDDYTIDLLKDQVDKYLELFSKDYDRKLSEAPTVFHAQMYFHNWSKDDSLFNVLKANIEFKYTLPNGSKVELVKRPEKELSTYIVFECWPYGGYSQFKLKMEPVSNLYSQRVFEHIDDLFIITDEDRAERKIKMLSSISRHLCEIGKGKKFVVFMALTKEEYNKEWCTTEGFEENREDDDEIINSLGFKFKRYWDTVVPKGAPAIRPKKETITLKVFNNGSFDREDYKFEDGKFLLEKGVSFVHYYSDYEGQIKNGSHYAQQLKEVSEIVASLRKGTKVVVSTRLKAKYFAGYETVEDFLMNNENKLKMMFKRAAYEYNISTASSFLELGIDMGYRDELVEIAGLSSYIRIEPSVFISFAQERLPKFVIPKYNNTGEIFITIERAYPLLKELSWRESKKAYVNLINKVNLYEEQLGLTKTAKYA